MKNKEAFGIDNEYSFYSASYGIEFLYESAKEEDEIQHAGVGAIDLSGRCVYSIYVLVEVSGSDVDQGCLRIVPLYNR